MFFLSLAHSCIDDRANEFLHMAGILYASTYTPFMIFRNTIFSNRAASLTFSGDPILHVEACLCKNNHAGIALMHKSVLHSTINISTMYIIPGFVSLPTRNSLALTCLIHGQ